jgi:flagellar biosynthesis GTPase FlhF
MEKKNMRVDLRTLKPNPFRDLTVDPIEDDPKILASIQRHDFWGGSVVRRKNGELQIGAGHVRVRMALQAGHTYAELFVSDTITDEGMVQIYAEENATQRGNTSPAIAGSVAAAIRLILQKEFDNDILRVEFDTQNQDGRGGRREGVGRRLILEILKNIPGYGDAVIRQQLANIKTSGDYDRIVGEEITKAQERLRAEEAARQRAEEARLEAEQRAEAARQEAERRRLEAAAATEEAERRAAEEAAQKAEEEQRQAEEEQEAAAAIETEHAAAVEAGETAISHEQGVTDEAAERRAADYGDAAPFDFVGVSRWMSNPSHIDTFRTMVLGDGLRLSLARDQQAALAKALVEEASMGGAEFTVAYIREHITAMVLSRNTEQNRITRAERQRLLRADWDTKVRDWQRQFSRQCRGMLSAAVKLEELNQDRHRPRGVTLLTTEEFRNAVEAAKRAIALLTERGII